MKIKINNLFVEEPKTKEELCSCIERLTRQLKYLVSEEKIVEKEDGRKEWMVSWPKYTRLRGENFRLNRENERLRGIIEDYINL